MGSALGELTTITSLEDATEWAKRTLPIKNTLIAITPAKTKLRSKPLLRFSGPGERTRPQPQISPIKRDSMRPLRSQITFLMIPYDGLNPRKREWTSSLSSRLMLLPTSILLAVGFRS